jgi:hypothetical protein
MRNRREPGEGKMQSRGAEKDIAQRIRHALMGKGIGDQVETHPLDDVWKELYPGMIIRKCR